MKAGKDFTGLGCGALIFNEKGQILMQLRGKSARNEHGMWAIPGGKVRFGEKVEDTIVRELEEECGIELVGVESIGYVNHFIEKEAQHWVSIIFFAQNYTGQVKNMEPNKCERIEWFSLDGIPENASPVVTRALELYECSTWNIRG